MYYIDIVIIFTLLISKFHGIEYKHYKIKKNTTTFKNIILYSFKTRLTIVLKRKLHIQLIKILIWLINF